MYQRWQLPKLFISYRGVDNLTLGLLVSVNQTRIFTPISTNVIRRGQFLWITATYTQHPSWASFLHFLTEPVSSAKHTINTVLLFQYLSYTCTIPCWLNCKPWVHTERSRACRWLHTPVQSPVPAWTLPSFAPACYDFSSLRDPGLGYFSMYFLLWIVYYLCYIPFFSYSLSSPKLKGSPQHCPVQTKACSTPAVSNQSCGSSEDGINPLSPAVMHWCSYSPNCRERLILSLFVGTIFAHFSCNAEYAVEMALSAATDTWAPESIKSQSLFLESEVHKQVL